MKQVSHLILALVISAMACAQDHPLVGSPAEIIDSPASFASLAASVDREVEARIAKGDHDDLAAEKLLLGIRVHLALLSHDDERALAAAARIRELQTDPADQAYAGLTTQAMVASRGPDGLISPQVFRDDFARRLRQLPMTPAMRAGLVRQRERMAATTAEAIRAEAKALAERMGPRGTCTLVEADQIIRMRHRLVDLVPLKGAVLEALDAAIAARPSA